MRLKKTLAAGSVLALSLAAVYACAATLKTGEIVPPSPPSPIAVEQPSPPWSGGETLSVVTWNLGYGGLGAGSNFFADGGTSYLPPSRDAVVEAGAFISQWLTGADADVVLTQENARASVVNLWVDLKRTVDRALANYGRVFRPDFQTRWAPPPLRIRNGLATYVRRGLVRAEAWPLPEDGDPYDGVLRRRYGALATYIDGPGGCWVFVNVHTSAFDEGAALRRRQIAALLALAEAEHRAGRRVVMGGDFNLRLTPTAFAHTTEEKFLFWVHNFPADLLPDGWRIAADPTVASVRTNERAFVAGQNYTAVIDGFILSPDVVLREVHGADLGFRHSDHQPVRAVFGAEGPERSPCAGGPQTASRRE